MYRFAATYCLAFYALSPRSVTWSSRSFGGGGRCRNIKRGRFRETYLCRKAQPDLLGSCPNPSFPCWFVGSLHLRGCRASQQRRPPLLVRCRHRLFISALRISTELERHGFRFRIEHRQPPAQHLPLCIEIQRILHNRSAAHEAKPLANKSWLFRTARACGGQRRKQVHGPGCKPGG
jgi:hypothetical protein